MTDILTKLEDACIASCTCLTKTPDFQHHASGCRYRVLNEGIEYIAEQAATIANHVKIAANDAATMAELRLQIRDAQEDAGNYRTSAEAEIAMVRAQCVELTTALRWHVEVFTDHFGKPTNPEHPYHRHVALALPQPKETGND